MGDGVATHSFSSMGPAGSVYRPLGLLQFLTPTVQFLIGLLVYHETFDAARLRGSLFIWCGLALYAADSLLAQRRMPRPAEPGRIARPLISDCGGRRPPGGGERCRPPNFRRP